MNAGNPHSVVATTVGSSLFANIRQESKVSPNLYRYLQDENWPQLARELKSMDPTSRICGAEINSIAELKKTGLIERDGKLHFICSDTTDGHHIKEILKSYYGLEDRNIHVIEKLDPSDSKKFKREGLNNLIRKIANITKQSGNGSVLFNPLGGYKAMVALVGLMGQALQVPVYYKFEAADGIIMPPMPISFDDTIYDSLIEWIGPDLEKPVPIDADDCIPESMLPFLDRIEEDGQNYIGCSALGQVVIEGYRRRHPEIEVLPSDALEEDRKRPSFRDDHYPDGFREYVRKVWSSARYVKTCYSIDYDGQKSIKHGRFFFRTANQEIVGDYKANFGARFVILTTAQTEAELRAIVNHLNKLKII